MTAPYTEQVEYINGRRILKYVCHNNLNGMSRQLNRYPQQVGAMLNDHPTRAIGDKMARHIETAFGLPENWLSVVRSESEAEAFLRARALPVTATPETAATSSDLREGSASSRPRLAAAQPLTPHQIQDPASYIEHMLRTGCPRLRAANFAVFPVVPYDVGPKFAYTALRGQSADTPTWFTLVVYDSEHPGRVKTRLLLSYERIEQQIEDGKRVISLAQSRSATESVAFAYELEASNILTMGYIHLIFLHVTDTSTYGELRRPYSITLATNNPYDYADTLCELGDRVYPHDYEDETLRQKIAT